MALVHNVAEKVAEYPALLSVMRAPLVAHECIGLSVERLAGVDLARLYDVALFSSSSPVLWPAYVALIEAPSPFGAVEHLMRTVGWWWAARVVASRVDGVLIYRGYRVQLVRLVADDGFSVCPSPISARIVELLGPRFGLSGVPQVNRTPLSTSSLSLSSAVSADGSSDGPTVECPETVDGFFR